MFGMGVLYSLEETKSLARGLALEARIGDCYCLIGDLGAGKTEFAREFIRALCENEVTVSSPTFNILQVYNDRIYHFDLYRLNNASELDELGLDDALVNGITLIEWPQIAMERLPKNHVEIYFEVVDEQTRRIKIVK